MNIRTLLLLLLSVPALGAGAARGQTNLIPNPDFSDPNNPLRTWRTAFPYESWYVDNVKYVQASGQLGKTCAVIKLPPGIAGNQGGKIESAFIKAEPGATYRVEIDCMTWDFSAKLHAEVWTHDPRPAPKPDKFCVPPAADHPALIMCFRAQMPDPPAASKKWSTVSREFTVPETVTVAGDDQAPEYLSLKAVVYAGTPNGGQSFFTNFRLYRIK